LNLPLVLDDEGHVAPSPDSVTISRAKELMESLNTRFQAVLDPVECITASPTGTISIDWYKHKSFVSVEVGRDSFSFYAELPDGSSPHGNTLVALESTLNIIFKK